MSSITYVRTLRVLRDLRGERNQGDSARLSTRKPEELKNEYHMAEVKNHPIEDAGEQMEVRRRKLAEIKDAGQTIYPNDFKPTHTASDVTSQFGARADEELVAAVHDIRLAGRIMAIRSFGKAAFFHLQDRRGRLFVYAR